MKKILLFCPLLIVVSSTFSQINTAQNGLSQPNASTVQLGGTLLQHTNIDLGSSYNLGILKGSSNYFSILNNGNVGIGTAAPGVRLHVNGTTNITLNSGEQFKINMPGPQNWNRGFDFNITDADGVSNSYGFKIVGYNNDGNRILRFNHYNATGVAFGGGSYSFEDRTYFNSGIGGPYHSDLSFHLNHNTQNPGTETGIKFYTESNPSTPLMSIMQGGKVGIGTSSPGGSLSVIGSHPHSVEAHFLNTNANGCSVLRVGVDAVAPTGAAVHDFNSGWAGTGAYTANTSSFGSFQSNGVNIVADNTSGVIRMFTGGYAVNNQRIIVNATGKVGIGTSNPQALLHISDASNPVQVNLGVDASSGGYTALITGLSAVSGGYAVLQAIKSSGTNYGDIVMNPNGGNVGVNTASPTEKLDINGNMKTSGYALIGATHLPAADAKLAVNGTIYSTKVKVTPTGWADYVFLASYRLRPLSEVEQYIQQYGHLPEVPSAEEVQKNGIDVGDNQSTLLKKIEELTLYVIDLNKQVKKQQEEISLLKQQSEKNSH
jgi:hypothetical protein